MAGLLRSFFLKLLRYVYTDKDDNYRHWAIGISIALVTSGLVYFQAIDAIDPSLNILRLTWYESRLGDPHQEYKRWTGEERDIYPLWADSSTEKLKKYVFYAGSTGGFYDKIGRYLDGRWEGTGPKDLAVVNIGGSAKIARAVYSNDRALGIVQEETLFDHDLLDGQVQIVSPLYDERVHVLYLKSAFRAAVDAVSASAETEPRLGLTSSDAVKRFFADARVRTRSSPSRTLPLAHYLMHFSGVSPGTAVDATIDSTLAMLERDNPSLEVAIIVAGAPLTGIENLLKKGKVGLMSLDPNLISEINPALNMALRPSVFSGDYAREDDALQGVTTLASRAMLIASRDVPSWIIRDVGDWLNDMRLAAQKTSPPARSKEQELAGERPGATDTYRYLFPATDYPFQVRTRKEFARQELQMLQILLIALLTIGLLSLLFHFILIWTISTYKHAGHSRDITKVYEKLLPRNSKIGRVFDDQPTPIVDPNHEGIINNLVDGISLLLKQAEKIRHDFTKGGILVGHQANLIDNVYGIKAIFQRQLGYRLTEAVLSGREIPLDRIRKLFTAGYIERSTFEALYPMAIVPAPMSQRVAKAEVGGQKKNDQNALEAES
jgi:hypothetical protein